MLQNIEKRKVGDKIYILDRTILPTDGYTKTAAEGKEGEHDSLLGHGCIQKLEQADCRTVHCALHAPVQYRLHCRYKPIRG